MIGEIEAAKPRFDWASGDESGVYEVTDHKGKTAFTDTIYAYPCPRKDRTRTNWRA